MEAYNYEPNEPMSNVSHYEIVDSERVIVRKMNTDRVELKNIYHIGTGGILCNDFETYVDFNDAVEVDFGNEE